jgi:cell division protein FtsB
MRFRFNHTSDFTKIIIVGQFFLLSYLLYSLTLSVYKSYQEDRHISFFEERNRQLETENIQVAGDIEYVSSDAYIEKLAKQNQGLVNPGEEVVIISKITEDSIDFFDLRQVDLPNREQSNFKVWWEFLFAAK